MRRSPEIEAVVRNLLDARSRGDYSSVRALYSESENLRSIGSDLHEWYHGDEAIAVSKAHGDELNKTVDGLLRLEAFDNGATGWAAVEQERTLSNGRSFAYRITIVFELVAGAWRMVQLHFSIPVPNVEVTGFELTRTLSDLLESASEEATLTTLGNLTKGSATVMFTDIVDSTAISQKAGDDEWSRMIAHHLDTVRMAVEREQGTVIKTLGDGGMYVFATAASALRAATDIQRQPKASHDRDLHVRVGVHTGDVVQSGDDVIGLTVHKAARVAAAAEGGQVLVSISTAGMVNPEEFNFGTPATVELKGISGSHTLVPLRWSSRPQSAS
jgi:class 3 adenylate cyclase